LSVRTFNQNNDRIRRILIYCREIYNRQLSGKYGSVNATLIQKDINDCVKAGMIDAAFRLGDYLVKRSPTRNMICWMVELARLFGRSWKELEYLQKLKNLSFITYNEMSRMCRLHQHIAQELYRVEKYEGCLAHLREINTMFYNNPNGAMKSIDIMKIACLIRLRRGSDVIKLLRDQKGVWRTYFQACILGATGRGKEAMKKHEWILKTTRESNRPFQPSLGRLAIYYQQTDMDRAIRYYREYRVLGMYKNPLHQDCEMLVLKKKYARC